MSDDRPHDEERLQTSLFDAVEALTEVDDGDPTPTLPPSLPVEIVFSRRRRKTVQATLEGDVIRVHAPAAIGREELERTIAELVPRLERRFRSESIDLVTRAATLSRRYDLPVARSVTWAEQRSQWGSCTRDGDVRVSTRLAAWPPWVLDYVLVHELAHLVELNHSPAFKALVERYPLAERARGFLMAMTYAAEGFQPNTTQ